MMHSIFHKNKHQDLENEIYRFLRAYNFNFSSNLISSTRAVGDSIQDVISHNFQTITSNTNISCTDFSRDLGRREMADLEFTSDNNYYRVDVMSHRSGTDFNMPNLTSVKRLTEFYQNDDNYFVLCLVTYKISQGGIIISHVSVTPIEFLSWDCLTLGALGWGQIQIANSNKVTIEQCSRKAWMLELCNRLINQFYPDEISKIQKRKSYFIKRKESWEVQSNV